MRVTATHSHCTVRQYSKAIYMDTLLTIINHSYLVGSEGKSSRHNIDIVEFATSFVLPYDNRVQTCVMAGFRTPRSVYLFPSLYL
ncbi:hypothetical protein RRG08_037230 [Elysia crispata]|uniref:Uncharacterized protein n=1 Tax=Elysia crispata TaxID=231223 RepID=A0AAE1A0P5_9GAST|nr:hypothetical protein RRG08_037230 [Elysia crispata]